MSSDPKKAVVLLSGGLDSATTMALARREGFSVFALSVAYGQRQAIELESARRVARQLGAAEHRQVSLDLAGFGGSALTTSEPVPKDRTAAELEQGIPVTYVPARNTILLSCALAWAEVLGAFDLFIGVNAVDYSGYPDCRPEFVRAFEALANVATKAAVEGRGRFVVHAPLLNLRKSEIILQGLAAGVDYSMTHSCYDPIGELACGRCDACALRRAGFAEAKVPDPTRYVHAAQAQEVAG